MISQTARQPCVTGPLFTLSWRLSLQQLQIRHKSWLRGQCWHGQWWNSMAGDSLVRSHYPRYTPASVLYLLNGRRTVVERRGVLWYTVVHCGTAWGMPASYTTQSNLLTSRAGPGRACNTAEGFCVSRLEEVGRQENNGIPWISVRMW